MLFKITPHSASAPPADALELLWQRMGGDWEDMSFAKVGDDEIEARTRQEAPISMTSDERVEIGRRAVLDVVIDVCEGAPELNSDWYAVSTER